ncbi:7TM-DISM domain-containing protein [Actomonas aquatica]|uniref:histidine kinase n=1 Tax=Actomonas aquatica TaxID=2866162 RepID=A0ABZ1CBA7_9BACT|nr:7TM-DISM domain-containing protein [Opitutus sp. WL0086]WRQ88670.1 7TM-DISM domain-containing protein [Opitutus sp. WL0086]
MPLLGFCRRCAPFVWFVFFWSLLPVAGQAQTPALDLTTAADGVLLGPHSEVLIDVEGQLSLEDVRSPEQRVRFEPVAKRLLSRGFTNAVYWIRFSLSNPGGVRTEWLLDYPFSTMDQIDFFQPQRDGSYTVQRVGDVLPLSDRPIAHPHFVFPVEVPSGTERTFYLRVQSHGGAMVVPLVLYQPAGFLQGIQSEHALWGITYGLLGILAAYGIFQAIVLREMGHLHYTLMVLSAIMGYLMVSGWGNYYLWGNWSYPVNNELPRVWLLASLFLLQAFRAVLDSRQALPRMDRVLRWGTYALAGGVLVSWLFPYGVQIQASLLCLVLALTVGVTASVLRTRQGYEPARYALMGGGAMLLSALFNNIRLAYGEAPINGLDFYSLAGGWAEALFFSFGFTSRYKVLRLEKERIQAEKLEIQDTLVGELQRASQLKDDFLANTSHELRTPLHGIIGLCQTMEDDAAPLSSAEQRRNLDLIITSAQRLSHLVGDILDFSRMKNQDLRLNQRDFDLRGPIRLACRLTETAIGVKPVVLRSELPAAPMMVHADEDRVQQVLFNLVGNAIKFTHQGSVTVSATAEGTQIRIRVSDTGIGIAPDKQAEVFQPFVQADGSISRNYGGTGLGLAISQQLVRLHGSQLTLESEHGRGSTFAFTLPVAQGQVPAAAVAVSPPPLLIVGRGEAAPSISTSPFSVEAAAGAEESALILVVDDEPLNIELLRSQLQRERYRVVSAMDGIQALEVLETERPDLVLLDLMMPRMDGYETCQRIRESHTSAELPVIILTAKGQMEDLVRGLRAGANDYLSKPFYREELLARIKSQLAQLRATGVLRENERLAERVQHFRQTEDVLKASEHRLLQILERSKEASLVVDGQGTITYASPALAETLGYAVDALEGMSWRELSESGDAADWPPPERGTDADVAQAVTLRTGAGESWSGQMWRAELDLGEEAWLFSFRARTDREHETVTPPRSLEWMKSVEVHRARLRRLSEVFQELPAALMDKRPEVLQELESLEGAMAKLSQQLEPEGAPADFPALIVRVMTDAIGCWEADTGKSAIELAEASGIWAVNIDDGRLRARSLERYLDVERLPQRPRWRNVIKTAHYVLSCSKRPSAASERLNASLEQLLQAAHRRNLMPPVNPV